MFVRGTTVFRTMVLSPGETPTFRAPLSRRPQGFGNLPISRPGLGKLPTRQSMSSLWSPECLLQNSQLGRVSPYGYEASPPLTGLRQLWYAACRNRPTNHFIYNLYPQHYLPVLWINLLPFGITLWSHPIINN